MMIDITEQDFDTYLTPKKGWIKNKSGYEYVYDYKMTKVPNIIIKVLSSIDTGGGKKNKGSDVIRVFAVQTDDEGKIVKGYIKKQIVFRTKTWRADLKKAYMTVRNQVFVRARKQGII